MRRIARVCGAGIFRGVALLLAVLLIALIWMQDASWLVAAEDTNLLGIKFIAAHVPQGYGSKLESALRAFGLEKALLLVEVVFVVKLILFVLGRIFLIDHRDRNH